MGHRAVPGLTAIAFIAAIPGTLAFAESAPGPLAIEGPTTCPTPTDVARKLRPLLGDGGIGQPGDRVRIDRDEQALRVALVAADGRVRGVRNVDQRHDCDELAEAAAVIVATWQAQGEGTGGSGSAGVRKLAVNESAASSSPASALSAQIEPDPGALPRGPHWFVGLAAAANAVAGAADRGIAPALTLEANAAPRVDGLGLHLRGNGGGNHAQGLPNGQAQWRRWAVSLGPSWSWATARLVVDVDFSAAAALLALDGTGFAGNESHTIVDLGTTAGLRVRSRRGLCGFVGLGVGFWPRRTVAYQAPDLVGSALPRWQGLVEGGIGWDR